MPRESLCEYQLGKFYLSFRDVCTALSIPYRASQGTLQLWYIIVRSQGACNQGTEPNVSLPIQPESNQESYRAAATFIALWLSCVELNDEMKRRR